MCGFLRSESRFQAEACQRHTAHAVPRATAQYALCAAVDWRRTNEARHGLYQVISDTLGKLDVAYTMPAVLDGQGCAPCNESLRSVLGSHLRSHNRRPAHLLTFHSRLEHWPKHHRVSVNAACRSVLVRP